MPAERAPERARARARARAPAAAGRATGADSRAHGVGPGSRARACGRRLALPRGGRGRGLAHQRQRGVRVRGLARQRDGRATGAGSRAHGAGSLASEARVGSLSLSRARALGFPVNNAPASLPATPSAVSVTAR